MNKHVDIDCSLNLSTGMVVVCRWAFENHEIVYHDTKVYSVKKYPNVIKYFAGETLRPSGLVVKQKTIFID